MNLQIMNTISTIVTVIATFLFLLLPYFLSYFTLKKYKGIYGKPDIKKSNVFMKTTFLIWFSIITYYVTFDVINDSKVKIITIIFAIFTIFMFLASIIAEIKTYSLKKSNTKRRQANNQLR